MKKQVYLEDVFKYKGYPCVCVFNRGGYRCGYVAVNSNHSYFGKDYDEDGPDNISCHWGLTYAGNGNHFYEASNSLWWFGFDCGHCSDGNDYDTAIEYGLITKEQAIIGKKLNLNFEGTTIKDLEFVKENCKMIVEQLIAADRKEKIND